MTKRFAFVSSSIEYTQGTLPLAQRMERQGYAVYWISFRGYERYWLLRNGVSGERILDTIGTFRTSEQTQQQIQERLTLLEGDSTPCINDIILMDRMLKRKPHSFAYAYLAHLQEVVSRFLDAKQIRFVSAGRDSALQIACAKICARLGIASVVPTVVRLPDDRYGFCRGHMESQFVSMRTITHADRELAREFLTHFREEKPIPSAVFFEKKNNQFLQRLPRDVKLFATLVMRGLQDRGNDFTRYDLRTLSHMYVRRRLNALRIKVAPPFEPLGEKPFVLYPYQMQPESGVDVLASFFSDQLTLIKQIARSVPTTHELYVKPHPDHVGGVARRLLIMIKDIPGVRLISPVHPSHALMLRASAVVTATGTMAFQAALHGVPAIIFAPEFFRKLPRVSYCSSPVELPVMLRRILNAPSADLDAEIVEFLAYHYSNSFVGRVTTYLGPYSEDETAALTHAYDMVYKVLAISTGQHPVLSNGSCDTEDV